MNGLQAPVLIMAGGTGGHIFPGLAVAAALRARDVPVLWLGAQGGMENRIVPEHRIEMRTLPVAGLRGKGLRQRLAAPWMLARAGLAAWRALRDIQPRSVLSLGGYVAGPGGIAAWLQRRPLLVHEQNRIAGFTNRVLAKRARRVMSGFPDAFPARLHAEWTGNPVRAEIAALPAPAVRFANRSGAPRLLVLGGSLGARTLNMGLPKALSLIPADRRPEVLHQCGAQHVEATRAAYARADVDAKVEPFIADMAAAYAWADLVICRAGALTLAELAAAGLGAILLPFPYAVDDHQTKNAEGFVAAGAAELVQDRDFDPSRFAGMLERLLRDEDKRLAMANAARTLAKPDAADVIAQRCVEVAA
ncbi:MAG: UDP-N-acetylglucosamine--N-acetylmuramyl-(pentapeptide) pyrophosphoryl-undecaprenol N-acetylglucosamine transferase [Rhodanobacteraceae bacterium]|jgi:UDP-N-acetylglucosamine--N-acetylmuramyl-(pentapeptide) pyrophosphoryl-undecaprenol N-acetylglucosamine transferase|nr:MAG: UDP-N-acetylglucosamine--N-acetylmuramyl-(pentapeptide) pyrophosphoryl-undecaprenol N-acetylglucosamine transferase [Rhodanobacteraceae bacterium]